MATPPREIETATIANSQFKQDVVAASLYDREERKKYRKLEIGIPKKLNKDACHLVRQTAWRKAARSGIALLAKVGMLVAIGIGAASAIAAFPVTAFMIGNVGTIGIATVYTGISAIRSFGKMRGAHELRKDAKRAEKSLPR